MASRPVDLLYIHASATSTQPAFLFMPAGVIGLLNEARARNLRVAAVNEPLELSIDPAFRLEEFVAGHRASVYAFDLHWHEHAHGAIEAARRVKRVDPDAHVVVGGMTASYFASELLAIEPAIDWVIRGFAEGVLTDLVAAVAAEDPPPRGVLARSSLPDLDAPDQTTLSALVHAHEYTQVAIHQWHPDWTGRLLWYRNGIGCSHGCSFCGGATSSQAAIFGQRRVARRSALRVASDLHELARQGITTVALTQDVSEASDDYQSTLFAAVEERATRIGIYLEANGLPPASFITRFARTFDGEASTIAITPLTEDQHLRRRNGKRFTNDEMWKTLFLLNEHGVRAAIYYATGIPGDTQPGRARTQYQMTAIQRRFPKTFCTATPLTLDPASPMAVHPERHHIESRLRCLADYVERTRLRSLGAAYDLAGYTVVQ